MPLQIECSSCGHKGTVPDNLVGKEIQCPKCQCLLVPLTADKMENYAAKVLFASPARPEEPTDVLTVPEEISGTEIPFTCPMCGETYLVSADLADKAIICRNCREPSRVDAPEAPSDTSSKKKSRRRRAKVRVPLEWFYILLAILTLIIGILLGRIFLILMILFQSIGQFISSPFVGYDSVRDIKRLFLWVKITIVTSNLSRRDRNRNPQGTVKGDRHALDTRREFRFGPADNYSAYAGTGS